MRLNLRTQLLLITLLVIALPIGAWQFARQIEQTLRDSHAQGLLDSARSMALTLATEHPSAWGDAAGPVLYRHESEQPPFLDGHADDWGPWLDDADTMISNDEFLRARIASASHASGLYLLIEVHSRHQVFSEPGGKLGDHLQLTLQRADGLATELTLAPLAPGWVETRGNNPAGWPRIQGYWQPRRDGWTLELQIPDERRPTVIGFNVHDADRPGEIARSVGTGNQLRRLVGRHAELGQQLQRLAPAGAQSWAVDADGWVLGYGNPRLPDQYPPLSAQDQPSWLGTMMFERLLSGRLPAGQERSSETTRLAGREIGAAEPMVRWTTRSDDPGILLAVSVPVIVDNDLVGSVILGRDADELLVKSNRAVLRLFGVSLTTLILVAVVLLGFATILSERIRRLRNSAEQAVGPDGRVRQTLAPARAPDELGDLGRSVSLLLDRLHEHQTYLRTLADKLAHELRTPLALIRSSLDNLEHARDPDDIARYCQRASEGSARLNRIFQAMSQAGRIEESIQRETRESFDLAALLENYVEARRQACPQRRFNLRTSVRPGALVTGSADLFAQLLDKLLDNAVDFSPERGRIDIRLSESNDRLVVDIDNEGPPLPDGASNSLFDSMVSKRKDKSEQVHLGLGLYIARLIAE
ncbi:MAG: ATP-binding protein, partial [Wenzhouxiangella sp.]